MRYLNIILAMYLAACSNEDTAATNNIGAQPTPVAVPKTYALESLDDLPECAEANENQIIYVIEIQAFMSCDSELAWVEIEGINGKDGRDGIDGKDGLNGRDGQDGQDGADGESVYSYNAPGVEFLHADSEKIWTILETKMNAADAVTACAPDSEIPTAAFPWSFGHYFMQFIATLKSTDYYWTNEGGEIKARYYQAGTLVDAPDFESLQYVICVEI